MTPAQANGGLPLAKQLVLGHFKNMRRVTKLLGPVGLLAFLSTAVWTASARAQDTTSARDTIAYTSTILTVREKPFENAQALGRLDADVTVRVYSCSARWCQVASGRLAGYVREQYISSTPTAPPHRAGRSYINSRGERVPSPTRGANDSVPPGASARCRDGTFSFSRSRRGTCSHHGGVADWLH